MEDITVNKKELLGILEQNREQHRQIFEEACDGYQAEVIRLLEEQMARVKRNKQARVMVSLPVPEDHTKDYDLAIRMVSMDLHETITLSEDDFQAYIMDDWSWKRHFLASNSVYSATAAKMSDS